MAKIIDITKSAAQLGSLGGQARARNLTKKRRREIAIKANRCRKANRKPGKPANGVKRSNGI